METAGGQFELLPGPWKLGRFFMSNCFWQIGIFFEHCFWKEEVAGDGSHKQILHCEDQRLHHPTDHQITSAPWGMRAGGWLETLGIICRSSVTRVTIMWLHQAPPMTGLTPTQCPALVQVTSQPQQQRTQGWGWREELHQHFKSPDVSKAAANLHTKQPAQITFNQLMRACCKIIAESVLDSSSSS